MVEEAGKEYAEVKTAKDTDSDEFFESLGSAFSEFIAVYNKRLVFDKENVRVKPLDRYNLGGSSQRNTVFLLARSGPKSMSELADNVNYDRGQYDKACGLSRKTGACKTFSAGEQPQAGLRGAYRKRICVDRRGGGRVRQEYARQG